MSRSGANPSLRVWEMEQRRFARWCDRGVWERMHQHFVDNPEACHHRQPIVRAHSCEAGFHPKKRWSTVSSAWSKPRRVAKVHVSVDGLGNPLRFTLTARQQHDITQAEELIAGMESEHVIADRAYDANQFRESNHRLRGRRGDSTSLEPHKDTHTMSIYTGVILRSASSARSPPSHTGLPISTGDLGVAPFRRRSHWLR